jgi:rhodanese-related sulfurtransferase
MEMHMNMGIPAISPEDLKKRLDAQEDFLLLDVRDPEEANFCKIEHPDINEELIPLHIITARFQELPKDKQIVVYCHHGGRSMMACQFLAGQGYEVFNLEGGIDLWSQQVDPDCPRY